MLNRLKLSVCASADTSRRRIGRDELRELILDIGKLPHKLIIFKIFDFRVILNIILVAVVIEYLPQFLRTLDRSFKFTHKDTSLQISTQLK